MDSSGRGGQREGRRVGEVEKEEKNVPNPGPTSMVVSWVGRSKARANLNGGEQDFENTSSTHKGNHRRRGAPSQGQPKWWRAGQGAIPLRQGRSNNCDMSNSGGQRIMLSPRTVLNGGEGGQEHAKEAKEKLEARPRTNLNGGELVGSTFLVLTFTFTLAFVATLVLAFSLAFLAPFWGQHPYPFVVQR